MRVKVLCCTADRPDGWSHSTTSGCGVLTLSIFRMSQSGEFTYHPKWHGKQWRYRNWEQLNLIQAKTDQIGLSCGSLVEYQSRRVHV